jgi:hypothetical protein
VEGMGSKTITQGRDMSSKKKNKIIGGRNTKK